MELASLIISIVALIAMGVVIFLLCKKNTSASTLKGEDVQDMCDNVQEYIQKDIDKYRSQLPPLLHPQKVSLNLQATNNH